MNVLLKSMTKNTGSPTTMPSIPTDQIIRTIWQVLHDADVVEVNLELGQVVVQVYQFHLEPCQRSLQRIVHLGGLHL